MASLDAEQADPERSLPEAIVDLRIRWQFITSCNPPANHSDNVDYHRMRWGQCKRLISRTLGISLPWLVHPYKLCNVRPAFGEIFADFTAGHDFWGFGDIDVL